MRMLSYTIQGRRIKKTFALHHEKEPQRKEDETPSVDWWFEDLCALDTDYFVRTVAAIKEKGVRAELIGAIISHYAVKWLPGLTQQHTSTSFIKSEDEDMVEAQRKQRRMVDALVRILPKEEDAVSSSFVLRLLRIASMVGASDTYRRALEKRVGTQLHSATLSDLLIPSFSHTCDTLLDADLVYRVITHFLHHHKHRHTKENGDGGVDVDVDVDDGVDLEIAMVAKLLDGYLAEAALDPNLQLSAFERLADCLPSRARVCHDGLYRAIDTYLKAHVRLSEEDRKRVCGLMDCFKLSPDACMHAAQNERLPDRTAIYVLFCEQLRGKTVQEEKDGCEMGSVAELKEEIEKMKEKVGKIEEMCMSMEMTEGVRRKRGSIAWGLNAWKWMSERRRMSSIDLDARSHPRSPPSKQH